jgi:transcriptional regulator with XRE-family HTH domain
MLSRIENGHVSDLQRSTMRALAGAFNVSLDELDAALTATVAQVQA